MASVLEEAQQRRPNNFWANLSRGQILSYGTDRQIDEAIGCFRAALAVQPNSGVTWTYLGNALFSTGRHPEANECFRMALQYDNKGLPPQMLNLFCVDLVRGHSAHVAKVANAMSAQYPQNGDLKAIRGIGQIFQGDFEAGRESIAEAIAMAPDSDLVQLTAVLRDFTSADIVGAAARTRALGEQMQSGATAAFFRSLAALMEGDAVAGELAAREGAKGGSNNAFYAAGQVMLGLALQNQGRFREAEAAAREAIRRQPDSSGAYDILTMTLASQGRFAEADRLIREAIGQKMQSFSPLFGYFARQFILGWFLEAGKLVDAYRKDGTDPFDASDKYKTYVLAWMMANRDPEAYSFHRRFMSLVPDKFAELQSPLNSESEVTMRLQSARSAVIAATAPAGGKGPQTPAERAAARADALRWLRDDLAYQKTYLGKPEYLRSLRVVLGFWANCDDFAPVRVAEQLKALPDDERKQWEAFWAEVEEFRAKIKPGTSVP